MKDAPSNTDDVIGSRDVIARIEELETERADLAEALAGANAVYIDAAEADAIEDAQRDHEAAADALVEWDKDNAEELAALKSLADQGEGYGDWEYGETLIRESYFKDYAQELAEDIGAIPKDVGWPCTCIDWEQACRELKMDYIEINFGDVSYFMRA